MQAKWGSRIIVVAVLSLVAAGCRGPELSPQAQEMEQQIRRAAPIVSGLSEERSFAKNPADLVPGVQAALKDSGVSVVRNGQSETGQWLLGNSMAGREVLVQIQPVYPGQSRVKLTVQGNDALATELLQHLRDGIVARNR